eukprot:6293203-Pyramimonas_sp.AAC.1
MSHTQVHAPRPRAGVYSLRRCSMGRARIAGHLTHELLDSSIRRTGTEPRLTSGFTGYIINWERGHWRLLHDLTHSTVQ